MAVKTADSPSPGPHGPPSSSPTTVQTTVPASPPPGGDTLPTTGLDVVVLVLVAVALLLVGAATMGLIQRRRHDHG